MPNSHSVSPGPETLLSAEGVSKLFDVEDGWVAALEDVSLTVRAGEFLCLVGPSGCGKSTLLDLFAGLEYPTDGEIHLEGKRVIGPNSRDTGYVFQRAVLLPWRTIVDNVLLPIELMKQPRRKYMERAHQLLQLVGLEGFENRYPHQLSGGMQQRAAIVRGLIHEPSVLLMDEPFGALDAITREQMNLELLSIWEATKRTVIFVTHDLREAAFLGDRVVVMARRPGRIKTIFESPFGRPRNRELTFTPEFGAFLRELEDAIA